MSLITFLLLVSLGMFISVAAGIILQFSWYERKYGLLSNTSSRHAPAMRYELDDAPELDGDLFW